MLRCFLLFATVLLTLPTAGAKAENEIVTDFLMGTDPDFSDPPLVKDFKLDFKTLWLQALQRPEVDYQRMAAETVAQAHLYGIPDLVDLVPVLTRILSDPASHRTARFAAARALTVLESRDSADALFEAAQHHGMEMRQLVEPVLAQWDYIPARAVWMERIKVSGVHPRDLVLAIRGLGQVRDSASLPAISAIAMDLLRPAQIRLEAANAAGKITDTGLEGIAQELSKDQRISPRINRLCALGFMTRHSSESAQQLLIDLAADIEPSVAGQALRRLNDIDSALVVPLAELAIKNSDPQVRAEGAKAYLQLPSPERIGALTPLVDDDNPAIRRLVGSRLLELAKKNQFDEPIRSELMRVLAGTRWQGQGQAALVLAMLDHKPAAERFAELLDSTRPEVAIIAAWGLRKLAEPRTVPAILKKILSVEKKRDDRRFSRDEDVMVATSL